MTLSKAPLFPIGAVYMTPGVRRLIEDGICLPFLLLQMHQHGDFGTIGEEDWQTNLIAIQQGDRVLSSYTVKADVRVWIITEADRSCTTLLLPEEY